MQTLEFILIFSALLGVLAFLVGVIDGHQSRLENSQFILREKGFILSCSSRADAAVNHFVLVPSTNCLDYSLALTPPHSPFTLILGGDSNHYG